MRPTTMTPEQMMIFQRFVALGTSRSIPALHQDCMTAGVNVTLRMLRRWADKFKWTELAKQVNDNVVAEVQEQMAPVIRNMVTEQIEALHTIQQRFIDRVAIDPNDPNLTDAQRARAIDPDFEDFASAIKLERLILGDPTERHEVVKTSRIVAELSPEKLKEIGRELIRERYGLPDLKNITPAIELDGES